MSLRSFVSAVSIGLMFAVVCAPSTKARDLGDLSQFAWLAGCWVGEGGEECWLAPRGGTMVGMNRGPDREGRQPFFEFLRIVEDSEGIVFLAMPAGRHPPTPFRAIEIGEERVVFANPEHDFPQRISYWLDRSSGKRVLRARVEASNEAGEWDGFEVNWTRLSPAGE